VATRNLSFLGIIHNKSFSFLSGIPISTDSGIKISKIGENYTSIFNFDENGLSGLNPNNYCVIIDSNKLGRGESELDLLAQAFCFTTNFFAQLGHMSLPSFYICEGVRKFKPKRKYETKRSTISSTRDVHFELSSTTTSDDFEKVFNSCLCGLQKDKALTVTFERYILALSRPELESRVVDLAICLESLLPFESEISFRFSLFGSILSSPGKEKRRDLYKILKDLYTLRSKIVHGSVDIEKHLKKLEGKWSTLLDVAKFAILYKLNYLNTVQNDDWQVHLDDIALGLAEVKE
jgi:hypothetical protein